MSAWISILNGGAVSIFGSLLSASFCKALGTKRNRLIFFYCMIFLLAIQGGATFFIEDNIFRQMYPLFMHLPLLLLLYILTKRLLWSIIAILSAYLCCQLRRWLALLVVEMFSGGIVMQDTIELIITLPMLIFLLHYVSPFVRQQSDYPIKLQFQFGLVPALYYVFDYLTRVYTDFLYSGSPVAVEFMPFVCCVLYLVLLLYNSTEERKRSQLEQVQKSLDLQLSQAVKEINSLRESQALAIRYRHDLRHHLQYLSVCIENGQEDLAQTYISGICKEIETQTVRHYCENETANLVLSAFAGRAQKVGITMDVKGALPTFIMVSDSDLCVILSNALENALHACQALAHDGKETFIHVQIYEREGKFFLQVVNTCENTVRFEKGIPVTDKAGHGIGVQSICAIVERYGGIYSFEVQDGRFVLRLSL